MPQFAKIQDSWDVYTKTNHAVTFRVSTKKLPATNHLEADEYWFVRKGTAKVDAANRSHASEPHRCRRGRRRVRPAKRRV